MEKKKIVGYDSLMIAMAKHIKTSSRELRGKDKIKIQFTFERRSGTTGISMNGRHLVYEKRLSDDELIELTEKALKETACRGVVRQNGCNYTVTLFGEPVKPFKMLQRLIKKYSGEYIDEYDVCTEYFSGNGKKDEEKGEYLCYNESKCQEGIDFIRHCRTPKDVLKCNRGDEISTTNFYYVINHGINLIVETPCGKRKAEFLLFT